jgi:hypothetical protein
MKMSSPRAAPGSDVRTVMGGGALGVSDDVALAPPAASDRCDVGHGCERAEDQSGLPAPAASVPTPGSACGTRRAGKRAAVRLREPAREQILSDMK